MTCAELEHVLPEIVDGRRSAEQEAHLRSCPVCASVVADLNVISENARVLQASEEPSPRVWTSIATTVGQWQAEMDLISHEARSLQASEEPSPKVWKAIQAELQQFQSEMELVSAEARELPDSEPSPRVWNSLEIALRQEGLIRKPHQDRLVTAGSRRPWVWAWMAPVAAALLVVGTMIYERGDAPIKPEIAIGRAPMATATLTEDQQMLEAVGSRAPAMRTVYENNLRNVNDYIHDAEQTVKDNPADEEAQESLVNAYAQKSMLYEMALDRSLP